MKKRLNWLTLPCAAMVLAGTSVGLQAQETSTEKRTVNVVIHGSHDDETSHLREKVAKALANSGVSEEIKALVLKEVEEALSKGQNKLTVKTFKSGQEAVSEAIAGKSESKKAGNAEEALEAKDRAMRMLYKIEKANPANGFTTHLFVDPKNDTYRIGVQCIQSEVEDGEEPAQEREGLEVNAVFDDSPAAKAGLKEGDILLTIDATKIKTIADLTNALQDAGKKEKDVTIEAKRQEKVISVTVKPTKMKSSDIGLENIRLALPTEGFVVNEEVMKTVHEQMKKIGMPEVAGSGQVWNIKTDTEGLKKDLAELKSELAELKKMLKEMAGKKSE